MSSPSGGDELQYPLMKALQVTMVCAFSNVMSCSVIYYLLTFALDYYLFQLDAMTSDDPAYVEPCITVLNKLNSQYYMGLKNELKVLLAI